MDVGYSSAEYYLAEEDFETSSMMMSSNHLKQGLFTDLHTENPRMFTCLDISSSPISNCEVYIKQVCILLMKTQNYIPLLYSNLQCYLDFPKTQQPTNPLDIELSKTANYSLQNILLIFCKSDQVSQELLPTKVLDNGFFSSTSYRCHWFLATLVGFWCPNCICPVDLETENLNPTGKAQVAILCAACCDRVLNFLRLSKSPSSAADRASSSRTMREEINAKSGLKEGGILLSITISPSAAIHTSLLMRRKTKCINSSSWSSPGDSRSPMFVHFLNMSSNEQVAADGWNGQSFLLAYKDVED